VDAELSRLVIVSNPPRAPGFNIEVKALPLDGRLVVLPPDSDDRLPSSN